MSKTKVTLTSETEGVFTLEGIWRERDRLENQKALFQEKLQVIELELERLAKIKARVIIALKKLGETDFERPDGWRP